MTSHELDLNADIIDARDIIARVEELENEMEGENPDTASCWENTEVGEEWRKLTEILDDLKGEGGDEQWRGDWYPVTLICEDHFTEYAEQLVCECYDLGKLPNFVHIDWEATAREVKVDYSEVSVDGFTYFYR
jgi:hypothetical protein